MKHILISILVTVTFFSNVFSANLVVTSNADSGSGSLREAIQNANDGDIISFDDAYTIYLKSQLELGNKSLTIDGEANGQKVKLNGNWADNNGDWIDDDGVFTRIFYVVSSRNIELNLNNLIITNGHTQNGDWDPSLTRNSKGAGIFIDMSNGGTLNVNECSIESNFLVPDFGGTDNGIQTYAYGAGIFSIEGGLFYNCTIKNNNIFARNNHATNLHGAGVYMQGNGYFENCWIVGNKITCDPTNNELFFICVGGGMVSYKNGLEVQNCVIMGNTISRSNNAYTPDISAIAGGLFVSAGKIYNSSITQNGIYDITEKSGSSFNVMGGGVVILEDSHGNKCDFQNSIVYDNFSSGTDNDAYLNPETSKYIALSNKDEFESLKLDNTSILLSESPFMKEPSAGNDNVWGTDDDDDGDLRLVKNSPCIDAGNPNISAFNYGTTDIYNRTRIANGTIDLGAAEATAWDHNYTLSGAVWANGNSFNKGKVYAIELSDLNKYVAESEIDDNGKFEIPLVPEGEYYLVAVPVDDTDYNSTYFGNETEIGKAISIDVYSSIYDIDISLLEKKITSVNGLNDSGIKLFPNPASDILHLKGVNPNAQIHIYNSVGVLVKSITENTNQISVNELTKGVYILKVKVDNSFTAIQFIKN